ncbi:MAG: ATP-binding protein [Candidatus Kerfeldbacteria bacterium]|nr:ATP-binding protein [Candidatus Kerfeldbacteria bacterium]
MNKPEKFVIMMVGKTHSGKTAFALKLIRKLPEFIHLEGDPIHVFILQNFPLIWIVEKNRDGRDLKNPLLKHRLLNEVFITALERGFSVILSSTNLQRNVREFLIQESHERQARVALVYLNIPNETLLERVRASTKPTYFLNQSRDFVELLKRQELLWFEEPWLDEADWYLEIRDEKDIEPTIEKLVALVKSP